MYLNFLEIFKSSIQTHGTVISSGRNVIYYFITFPSHYYIIYWNLSETHYLGSWGQTCYLFIGVTFSIYWISILLPQINLNLIWYHAKYNMIWYVKMHDCLLSFYGNPINLGVLIFLIFLTNQITCHLLITFFFVFSN